MAFSSGPIRKKAQNRLIFIDLRKIVCVFIKFYQKNAKKWYFLAKKYYFFLHIRKIILPLRRFAPKKWAFLDKNKLMKTRIAHIILLLSFALLVGPVYGSTNGVPSDSEISAISAEPSVVSAPIKYKVAIDNGSISEEYFVEAGETITFSVGTPSNDCLEFVNWSDGNNSTTRTVAVNSDLMFKAIFKTKQYNISVYSADSSKGSVSIQRLTF